MIQQILLVIGAGTEPSTNLLSNALLQTAGQRRVLSPYLPGSGPPAARTNTTFDLVR
ncbi:hypothetical protein ACSCB1_38740 [Streptomyces europaeiscabiei]|uniref:hypothetical protein n=1 Tax=Streptomyces TaxID=1883 RepID=UPI000A557FB7|nr:MULTISPECIES: hypothetical protein [Streptomyces]